MSAHRRTRLEAMLALSAGLAMLVVSIAAVIPGHWHNGPQGRICDICRIGLLAAPGPMVGVEIQSPAPVGWHTQCVELCTVFEPVFASSSPRAPPA